MSLKELVTSPTAQTPDGDRFNTIVRRKVSGETGALDLMMPGARLSTNLKKNNSALLARGTHGGAVIDKNGADVRAAGGGATMSRRVTVNADATFAGVTFTSRTGEGALVVVNSPAAAVFRGCVFEKPEDDTSSMVTVGDGGKAAFTECVFRGSATTASPVISHPLGAATDVQVAFCYNGTGNTLVTGGTAAVAKVVIVEFTAMGVGASTHELVLNGQSRVFNNFLGASLINAADDMFDLFTEDNKVYPPIGAANQPVSIAADTPATPRLSFTAIVAGVDFTLTYAGTLGATATVTITQPNVAAVSGRAIETGII